MNKKCSYVWFRCEGEFKHGKFDSQGKLYYDDHIVYGNNQFHGRGKSYEGRFKYLEKKCGEIMDENDQNNNIMHGK